MVLRSLGLREFEHSSSVDAPWVHRGFHRAVCEQGIRASLVDVAELDILESTCGRFCFSTLTSIGCWVAVLANYWRFGPGKQISRFLRTQ